MSAGKKDKPSGKLTPEDLEGPLVAGVQQSLGELFRTTIDALREDVVKTIQTNKSDSHLEKAIQNFTNSMLIMIAERVEATMPKVEVPKQSSTSRQSATQTNSASQKSDK
jgi:hypothetical protein